MKWADTVTSLRSSHLIDHHLHDLMHVLIQVSPSLSLPYLPEYNYAFMNAIEGTPIDSSSSRPANLVDLKETNQNESKDEDDTYQPSIIEWVNKPIAPFPNILE